MKAILACMAALCLALLSPCTARAAYIPPGSVLAVLPFECLDRHGLEADEANQLGRELQLYVEEELQGNTGFSFMDEQSLLLARDELALSEALSLRDGVRLGRAAGARYVLWGTVSDVGSGGDAHSAVLMHTESTVVEVQIMLQLIDTETGDIVATAKGVGRDKYSDNFAVIPTPFFALAMKTNSNGEKNALLVNAVGEATDDAVDKLLSCLN